MWGRGVVAYVLGGGIRTVIEQYSTSREAMRGPVVDAAFMIVGDVLTVKVASVAVVIECFSGNVRHVAESIPLGAGLGVHDIEVVVGNVSMQRLNFVLKLLAAEGGLQGNVERKVQACHLAGLDFGGGGFDAGGGEEVEATNVIVGSPDPGCILRGAGDAWEVLAERKGGGVGVEGDGGCCFAHDAVFDLG